MIACVRCMCHVSPKTLKYAKASKRPAWRHKPIEQHDEADRPGIHLLYGQESTSIADLLSSASHGKGTSNGRGRSRPFRCDTKPGGINVGNAARKKSFLRGQASPFVKRLFVRGRYVCLPAGVAQVMRRAIHTASRASTIASVTTKTAKVEKG